MPLAWLAWRVTRPYASAHGEPTRLPIAASVAATFAWAAVTTPPGWILALSLGLGWTLVCLAAIDLTCFRLPDPFTLPLLAAGLGVSAWLPGRPVLDHLAGAAVAWGAVAALAWTYRRWRGADGIGLGDAKLLGAAGAWLGWRPLPSVVLIACGAAFIWVGFQAIARGRVALSDRLAFGAPLCLAIWIVWLHGPLAI
jgi:leader peptidase (prepilin peptidase)/N-methyltransferase